MTNVTETHTSPWGVPYTLVFTPGEGWQGELTDLTDGSFEDRTTGVFQRRARALRAIQGMARRLAVRREKSRILRETLGVQTAADLFAATANPAVHEWVIAMRHTRKMRNALERLTVNA